MLSKAGAASADWLLSTPTPGVGRLLNSAGSSARSGLSSVLRRCGVDSKLQFSLEPPGTESGYAQWLEAMRAVARLPDGMPHHFRKKLWLTLADHHIESVGLDWPTVVRDAFNDRLNPDDDKLGEQIIKIYVEDLHRTGWSGLSGMGERAEQERILLKRVLLAYARFNKTIGYCQGFNVIAALVLDVTEFKEESALKVMIFLVEQVLPAGYFDQTLRALSVDMAVLRDLLNQRLPKLAAHLENLQKSSESEYEPPLVNVFSMQWFLTLFATCLPRAAVFRIWDSLMLQGSEILLRAALAIWARSARVTIRIPSRVLKEDWDEAVEVSGGGLRALTRGSYPSLRLKPSGTDGTDRSPRPDEIRICILYRRVMKAKSADEFYGVMGPLCAEVLQMSNSDCNNLIQTRVVRDLHHITTTEAASSSGAGYHPEYLD